MKYKPLQDWSDRERQVDKRGYVRIKVPEHPASFCSGWIYEHRLVAEKKLGRLLKKGETVHHIMEKWRNLPEYLLVCSFAIHENIHRAA